MAKIVSDFKEIKEIFDFIYPTKGDHIECYVNKDEFLFYSNNPETVTYEDFADKGKYFCRETVKGNGQIYIWHRNLYTEPITSLILMYNPNNFDIELTFTNIGLTIDPNWASDIYAWRDYLTGANNPIKINIPSNLISLADRYQQIVILELSVEYQLQINKVILRQLLSLI